MPDRSPPQDAGSDRTPRAIAPDLSGVSETMLWSLYNRACEARRPHPILADPDSVRIASEIDYDFAGRFGRPRGLLAARAASIDQALRHWLQHHPEGTIVSLGEGLETQSRRVDNGRLRWLTVDLPAAIALREKFLPPSDRFRHRAGSALDFAWMDEVDAARGLFIVAQGLLMYLEPAMVRGLLHGIAERFPAADIVFDAVPRWFSSLTLRGLQQTPRYRLPPMPWGIDRDELPATLQAWHPRLAPVTLLDYQVPRGLPLLLATLVQGVPGARHKVPTLVHIMPDTRVIGHDIADTVVSVDGFATGPTQPIA